MEDIFNADEFGLFFQALPSKTLELKREKFSGGKYSKVRLTETCEASVTGEKLPLLVIGKSKNLRCFKNVKTLPFQYKAHPKIWMDTEIFTDWIKHLDWKLLAQNRKVAFIIDNCPVHPDVPGLMGIYLLFLPPELMGQGVIRSLKAKYCTKVISKYINAFDSNKELPNITILDGINMLEQLWSTLPDITIFNCFRKAGISRQSQQDSNKDTDDPFTQLTEILDDLRVLGHKIVSDGLTSETLIATFIQHVLCGEELLHQNTNENVEIIDEESDEMESTEKKPLIKKALFEAVNLTESFALFQNNDLAKQF